MAHVTIGVPVFNAESHLADCLGDLARQDYDDFSVIVSDNASTDRTSEIAQRFCATDGRFRYVRQPLNRGAIKNFFGLLKQAQSDLFMWRAADDRSASDYVSVLAQTLLDEPAADLAVGDTLAELDGVPVYFVPAPGAVQSSDRIEPNPIFDAAPSWIYGLFRRPALLQVMRSVAPRYELGPFGWDFLAMFPFLFDSKVVGSSRTFFVCSLRDDFDRLPDGSEQIRRQFMSLGRRLIANRYASVLPQIHAQAVLTEYCAQKFKPGEPVRRFAAALENDRFGIERHDALMRFRLQIASKVA